MPSGSLTVSVPAVALPSQGQRVAVVATCDGETLRTQPQQAVAFRVRDGVTSLKVQLETQSGAFLAWMELNITHCQSVLVDERQHDVFDKSGCVAGHITLALAWEEGPVAPPPERRLVPAGAQQAPTQHQQQHQQYQPVAPQPRYYQTQPTAVPVAVVPPPQPVVYVQQPPQVVYTTSAPSYYVAPPTETVIIRDNYSYYGRRPYRRNHYYYY